MERLGELSGWAGGGGPKMEREGRLVSTPTRCRWSSYETSKTDGKILRPSIRGPLLCPLCSPGFYFCL